jgi:hypothetical protein
MLVRFQQMGALGSDAARDGNDGKNGSDIPARQGME